MTMYDAFSGDILRGYIATYVLSDLSRTMDVREVDKKNLDNITASANRLCFFIILKK